MKRFLVTAVFALACIQQAYSAGIIMNIYPEDGDVLATFSGSLDLTRFYDSGSVEYRPGDGSGGDSAANLYPKEPFIVFASSESTGDLTFITDFDSQVTVFGTSELVSASSFSGSTMFLYASDTSIETQQLGFDDADIDENNIVQVSGTAIFENNTISGLGLNPGTYEINDSDFAEGENFTLTITPEPATIALLGLGGAFIRKRRA
ncbi:PEP-CTERM sorting domain-containing protein [Sedimentisphaera salicampi]|uniref:Ice-binding protein C-terminal domain-containing protein n=1 Tax=Sedimentisphaera salicampi TaxID=1941349 RepID=A0A1W6LL73_9BACT|nr:PEP-CTERM sorting domain-containing protein [Sedimentisphaera salicampi]ARN56529.1 hypothetical protein STSP1_00912 [Sedimentisphaera salicampi]